MELVINRGKIKEAITKMRSSLDATGVKPILKHFLFEIKDKNLSIKASNGVISTTWITPVDSEDNFSFTMLGETIGGLVSSLDNDEVTFKFNPETDDVMLTCGKYKWEGLTGKVSSFPEINLPTDLEVLPLPNNFENMLKKVFFSISKDIEKADLNSLCVDVNKDNTGKLSLVSTDRIRLSYATAPLEGYKGNHIRFVVPKNSVSELMKLEPDTLMYDKDLKKAYFKKESPAGTYIFQTVLTHAEYPDIYVYLDQEFDQSPVTFNKSELIKVLKRVKLTSDKTSREGKVEFNTSEAVLTSLSSSNKSRESITASFAGDVPHGFNVNLDFMAEYLNLDSDETVDVKVVDDKCMVFDKDEYRHVLSIHN